MPTIEQEWAARRQAARAERAHPAVSYSKRLSQIEDAVWVQVYAHHYAECRAFGKGDNESAEAASLLADSAVGHVQDRQPRHLLSDT